MPPADHSPPLPEACPGDAREELRRLLVAWYRRGEPWPQQPTLGDFRTHLLRGRQRQHLLDLVDALIARLGPQARLRSLRLRHLLDL